MRIMVAIQDPESEWSDAVASYLRKCGYGMVTQTWSAEDVLSAYRKGQMDLLILSDMLDGQSSIPLCRKIEQVKPFPESSIRILLFLTGEVGIALERYLYKGMFSYILTPPYNLEQFGQRLRQFETADTPFLISADIVIEETLLMHELDRNLSGYDYVTEMLRIELEHPGALLVLKDPLNQVAEKYRVSVPQVNQAVFRILKGSWQALGGKARETYRIRPDVQGYPGAKRLLLSLAKSCHKKMEYR